MHDKSMKQIFRWHKHLVVQVTPSANMHTLYLHCQYMDFARLVYHFCQQGYDQWSIITVLPILGLAAIPKPIQIIQIIQIHTDTSKKMGLKTPKKNLIWYILLVSVSYGYRSYRYPTCIHTETDTDTDPCRTDTATEISIRICLETDTVCSVDQQL